MISKQLESCEHIYSSILIELYEINNWFVCVLQMTPHFTVF